MSDCSLMNLQLTSWRLFMNSFWLLIVTFSRFFIKSSNFSQFPFDSSANPWVCQVKCWTLQSDCRTCLTSQCLLISLRLSLSWSSKLTLTSTFFMMRSLSSSSLILVTRSLITADCSCSISSSLMWGYPRSSELVRFISIRLRYQVWVLTNSCVSLADNKLESKMEEETDLRSHPSVFLRDVPVILLSSLVIVIGGDWTFSHDSHKQ